jgi:hypothetical protein
MALRCDDKKQRFGIWVWFSLLFDFLSGFFPFTCWDSQLWGPWWGKLIERERRFVAYSLVSATDGRSFLRSLGLAFVGWPASRG